MVPEVGCVIEGLEEYHDWSALFMERLEVSDYLPIVFFGRNNYVSFVLSERFGIY